MIGLIDLSPFSTRSHFVKHIGGVTTFKVGGGGKFFEVKNGATQGVSEGGCCPEKLELF